MPIDRDRRDTKSIKITDPDGRKTEQTQRRAPSVYFFLLFFYFFRAVHDRTSSKQMAEYDSQAKLASEYLATNADFANHSSIETVGPAVVLAAGGTL